MARTGLRVRAGRCRFMLLVLVAMAFSRGVMAAGPFQPHGAAVGVEYLALEPGLDSATTDRHVSRALAAGLALTLGPFGAHRLYLGTTPKVPLLYGLTFGGFGVLVLIDLGHILFTKDLSAYQDSRQVLMWAKPHGGTGVTPP